MVALFAMRSISTVRSATLGSSRSWRRSRGRRAVGPQDYRESRADRDVGVRSSRLSSDMNVANSSSGARAVRSALIGADSSR